MLVPLSWLAEYTLTKLTAEKLAEKLLLSGTKVEEITRHGKELVLNLEITSNRPDTLSVYGVAREAAVVSESDLLPLDTNIIVPRSSQKASPSLKVIDKNLMPFYTLGLVKDLKVESSPNWLAERLELAGIRPINNIVDITNYVMVETGQPMHAFDFDKIEGELTVRASKEGEIVRTLDSLERKLPAGAIIIEDKKKLIDLAGLMGGENSEIDKNTKNILLHVPIYDPVSIRRTSQYLGLRTEASNRFEKKLDPAGHFTAFERALKLLIEIAGARLASEPRSVSNEKENKLDLEISLLPKVLGIEPKINEVMNILTSLGFQVSVDPFKEGVLQTIVPSWRTDIDEPIDLVEEVGRIWGYNRFPKTLPKGEIPQHLDSFEFDWENHLARQFKVSGFNETTTYTLLSRAILEKAGFDPSQSLKLENPMSEDFEHLRISLLPELLEAVRKNQLLSEKLEFFEIGRIFSESSKELPFQPKVLSFVSNQDFSKTKGLIEKLLSQTDMAVEAKQSISAFFNPEVSFVSRGEVIATIGKVDPTILRNFEIETEVVAGTLFFETLIGTEINYHYKPLGKYPPVIEDISMFVDESTEAGEILKLIEEFPLVEKASVFDIFQNNTKKSIGVRITYQSSNKTLTDAEVAKVREAISKKLTKKFKAKIRKA